MTTSALWKPGSTASRRPRARSKRPVATTSATESATSAPTRARRQRCFLPPIPERAPSRSSSARAPAGARSAGARPKPSPVAIVSAVATATRRQSTEGDPAIGSVVGTRRARVGVATTASSTPRSPPPPASSRLSVSIWRTSLVRPPPSAARTASSWPRARERASSRLARLVQASSSRQSAAASSARSSSRDSRDSSSRRRTERIPVAPSGRGYSTASPVAMPASSARAASTATPRRRRPITRRKLLSRSSYQLAAKRCDIQSLVSRSGKRTAAGSTPMTTVGSPSRSILRPITSRSPPNRLRQ